MEYRVITAPDTNQLQVRVQQLLDRGWQLQGGVGVAMTYDAADGRSIRETIYAQAMVKPKD